MDRALREHIKEDKENCCEICEEWCGHTGSPHHIIKRSEEPLLTNCKKNIIWTCFKCHRRTEEEPGFNRRLQKELQKRYFKLFLINKHYTTNEISQIVTMPVKDLEKAMQKGRVKWEFVDGIPKIQGLEAIRFLMAGKLR